MRHLTRISIILAAFALLLRGQTKDITPRGLVTTTFANLGTWPNGTIVYCSDCTSANPAAGGGTGAVARRENGVWNSGGGGGGGGGASPYSTSTITASPMAITAVTHGQGAFPQMSCYDATGLVIAGQQEVESCNWFANPSTGDITLRYTTAPTRIVVYQSGASGSGGGTTVAANPPFLITIAGTNYVLPYMTQQAAFSTTGFSQQAGTPTTATVGAVTKIISDGTTNYNLYGASIGTNTTITSSLACNLVAGGAICGTYISEAATGRMYFIGQGIDAATSTTFLYMIQGTTGGAHTSVLTSRVWVPTSGPLTFQITVGTNVNFNYSVDGGQSYTPFYTNTKAALFSSGPDTMGIVVSGAGFTTTTAEVISWKTAP